MTIICAIDPGLDGAIAFLKERPVRLLGIYDMPTTERTHGKGRQVDANQLARLLDTYPFDLAVIERVGPMPGQGVTSMFHFGESVGIVVGVLAARHVRTIWVTPQKWKHHFSLTRRGKGAALTVARERWPKETPTLFSRKKDIGRADAALIGLFAIGDPPRSKDNWE